MIFGMVQFESFLRATTVKTVTCCVSKSLTEKSSLTDVYANPSILSTIGKFLNFSREKKSSFAGTMTRSHTKLVVTKAQVV